MKNFILTFLIFLFCCVPAFAEYKPVKSQYNLKFSNLDNYEPIPKNLQYKYVKKIPEKLINNYRKDMNNALSHILYDKITYNDKTLKQMLLDFDKKSNIIYETYLNNKNNIKQNIIFIKQLKQMNGTISLYPNTIIEQIQPYIKDYYLNIEPDAESDIFLYKYYVKDYHIKYSKEFKDLLELKENIYTKIDLYISKITDKI